MKKIYLERMEITNWQLRQPAAAVATDAFLIYVLQNAAQQKVGYLIAENSTALSNEEQKSFLEKIAAALTPHFQACNNIPENEMVEFAILLGEKTNFLASCAKQVVYAQPLLELMQNTENKKQLWVKIKPFAAQ